MFNDSSFHVFSGRPFSPEEIEQVKGWVKDPDLSRTDIARLICESFSWVHSDGSRPKIMSARVALLQMERRGLLTLPSPRLPPPVRGRWRIQNKLESSPSPVDTRPAGAWGTIDLRPVAKGFESEIWNDFIERYHYLGYTVLPGAQIRYIAWVGDKPLACLSFSASAWKTAPRDKWIGWSPEVQKKNLPLVVNNSRYLILPWIQSKNLASKLLGMAARRIEGDWLARYHFAPVLLETFVDSEQFAGTCYRAANWIYVGQTQGRGKKDVKKDYPLPVKDIWLYPLRKDFREILLR
ncbi:MAG: DUF4338 domain-containing protein [Leptospirillia bacterium]